MTEENWVRKLHNTIESISIQWHKTKTFANIAVYQETCDNWNCLLILIDPAEWVVKLSAQQKKGTVCFAAADSGETLDCFCVSGDFALFDIEQNSILKTGA